MRLARLGTLHSHSRPCLNPRLHVSSAKVDRLVILPEILLYCLLCLSALFISCSYPCYFAKERLDLFIVLSTSETLLHCFSCLFTLILCVHECFAKELRSVCLTYSSCWRVCQDLTRPSMHSTATNKSLGSESGVVCLWEGWKWATITGNHCHVNRKTVMYPCFSCD